MKSKTTDETWAIRTGEPQKRAFANAAPGPAVNINNLIGHYAAILVVGSDLTIHHFTDLAAKAFNLSSTDLGRPLGDICHPLLSPAKTKRHSGQASAKEASPVVLEDLVREAIASDGPREHEVQDKNGHWFVLRARPRRTLENEIEGAVLMLLDVDVIKGRELAAKTARNYAEACLRTARDPMIVLRPDLRVNSANEAFYKGFKTTRDQTEGRLLFDLNNGGWGMPKLRLLLEEILPRHSFFNDFELTLEMPVIGKRTMLLDARELDQADETPPLILLAITDMTERQRLDERVRLSEIRFRRLFEAGRDGILILDSVSRTITDANPFIIEFLGRSRSEMLGQELWQIGLLKDERSSHAAFRELQQKGAFQVDQWQLRTKSGQLRTVEIFANCYEENKTSVIQCNIRDISARKQAEDALHGSEDRYRTLFDLGPMAVYSCNTAGVIQEFNLRAVELWGCRPSNGDTDEKFCGSYKLFRPDGSFMPHAECPMAEVITGQRPGVTDGEVLIERPDGSRITVIVNIRPLKDKGGAITGAINCFYDITGRKQAEMANASLAAIVESSDDAIISKNLHSIITSWNAGAERLFGYTAREAIGQSITMLIPSDRQNEEPEILKRLKQGGRVDHFETVRVRKDGSLVKISLTISPVKDSTGQIVGASKIARALSPALAHGGPV